MSFQPREFYQETGVVREPWALELIERIKQSRRNLNLAVALLMAVFVGFFADASLGELPEWAWARVPVRVLIAAAFIAAAYHGIKHSHFIYHRQWQARGGFVVAKISTIWSWPWSPAEIVVLRAKDPWLYGWPWDYFTRRGRAIALDREHFDPRSKRKERN